MSLLGLALRGENFVPGKSNALCIEKAKRIDRRYVPESLHPAFPDPQTFKRAWKGKTRIQPQSIQAIRFWLPTPENFESLLRVDCVTSRALSDGDYVSPFIRALHCMSSITKRNREPADHEKQEAIADVCSFLFRRLAPDKQRQVNLPGLQL